jgi:hypothetical protein
VTSEIPEDWELVTVGPSTHPQMMYAVYQSPRGVRYYFYYLLDTEI